MANLVYHEQLLIHNELGGIKDGSNVNPDITCGFPVDEGTTSSTNIYGRPASGSWDIFPIDIRIEVTTNLS